MTVKNMESENKVLKYGDLETILKDISEMPEVSREEKEVKSKDEIIKTLEKGILSMLRKGYSIKATADFLNERLSPYTVNETEVKKLLRKVTAKKKTPASKPSSKVKKRETVSDEKIPEQALTQLPQKDTEGNVHVEPKVQMPYSLPEEERIYLVSTIDEKDEIKALGARYEVSVKKWYIWKNLPQEHKDRFKKWLPQG